MATVINPSNDELQESFKILNMSYPKPQQILANANHSLMILHPDLRPTSHPVTLSAFCDVLNRMAKSEYGRRQGNRHPSPYVAAAEGAFSSLTRSLILDDEDHNRFLQDVHMRQGIYLVQGGVKIVQRLNLPLEIGLLFLHELALATSICLDIPAKKFDSLLLEEYTDRRAEPVRAPALKLAAILWPKGAHSKSLFSWN